MTDFYFVRHGQTAANAAGLKQGTINSEITYLSETGKQQVESLRKGFDISFADRIIVSQLQRTKDTAAILNQSANLPVTYDKRLLEISYGDWDGEKNADLMSKYPKLFDFTLNDVLPAYADVAHGETFDHVIDRVAELMQETATNYPNDKIILVTHGFTIKAAVLAAIGRPKDMMVIEEPDNTSVTRITLQTTTHSYYLRYYNRVVNSQF
ncbi:histidine phosphatase family protein [Lentilactobacillus buchneri]|uniref:Phosphoglycerate mutase n=1 Tax=Lentilactobacillus buchneri DSM 20057 TaxID=1423728 RepID=A0A4R5NT51_LENBU|nr:histidine phosphatase family protein [Lentilactobacillus buchneri]KRK67466.1 phosphoglycerate mutase [Lentilactobacillus buchneri DSM 20057]MCT3253679.1 histidine phosphatase family protein [Lentilactobacillus buchneri]MCT3548388.1 histidine phosphatase family protein [Lentilactobacillus buchneri]MCT4438738.1 histidine phosphatase family protein [Lentilactobacillus buchneri]MQM69745.1 histidine phosphatase family protein [Lentilactobacillus buchneri]